MVTILTSNRTRELHDALRRRCLYHWIDYPDRARERAIIERHAPGIAAEAAERLVEAVAAVRRLPLVKRPGIAETHRLGARRRWCWSATAPPGPTRCAARSGSWSRTRRTRELRARGPSWS